MPDLFKQFHCNKVSSVKSEPAGVLTEGDAYLINERRESHRVCRMVRSFGPGLCDSRASSATLRLSCNALNCLLNL
jgi:hypothetical protein